MLWKEHLYVENNKAFPLVLYIWWSHSKSNNWETNLNSDMILWITVIAQLLELLGMSLWQTQDWEHDTKEFLSRFSNY